MEPTPEPLDGPDAAGPMGPRRMLAVLRQSLERRSPATAVLLLLGMAAAVVVPVLSMRLLISPPTVRSPEPLAWSSALDALDQGDYAQARELAQRLRSQSDSLEPGAPDFVFGISLARQAPRVADRDRASYYLMAAQYLAESQKHGFVAGREGEGLSTLAASLAEAGRIEDAIPALEQSLREHPSASPSLMHRLLARCYVARSKDDLPLARAHLEQYLAGADLSPEDRDASLLEYGKVLLALDDKEAAVAAMEKIQPDSFEEDEALVLRAKLIIAEAAEQKARRPQDEASQARALELYSQARTLLARIQGNSIDPRPPIRQSMYLVGVCMMESGELVEALAHFARLRQLHPGTAEGIAASLHEADIMRRLEHDEDVDASYVRAIEAAGDPSTYDNPWITLENFREHIVAAYDAYLKDDAFERAIDLAEHCDPLFARETQLGLMASAYQRWAEHTMQASGKLAPRESQEMKLLARKYFRQAGHTYQELANLILLTREYSDVVYQSAQSFMEGHDYRHAAIVLQQYLKYEMRRRRPQALVALGEAQLAMGQIDLAIGSFHECCEFFPNDVSSYRARLLSSKAHQEKGDLETAESLLNTNLVGEALTPASKEWRESLFALGTLLYAEGRYAEAIERLEEAVARYPDSPTTLEAQYLIAQSYRQAASEPRRQLDNEAVESSRVQLDKQVRQLLESALDRYDQVQTALSHQQQRSELSLGEEAIFRNSVFARASTLFELGRYEEAVRAYTAASNRYQREPEVLLALVQAMTCYQRLNREREARGVLEQAKLVLERMDPDADFMSTTNFSRDQWRDILEQLNTL